MKIILHRAMKIAFKRKRRQNPKRSPVIAIKHTRGVIPLAPSEAEYKAAAILLTLRTQNSLTPC